MKNKFALPDIETVVDLQSYLQRAKRLDPDGMVRLRAFGPVLAAYVAPIWSGDIMASGPTVLGLRTCDLAGEGEVDSIVPIGAVLDRLAVFTAPGYKGKFDVTLPASERAPWAGISPPRQGWQLVGTIPEATLTQIAKDGIEEVKNTIPTAVGGPIAARIRGEIWGRGMTHGSLVPTGAAFVAAGLGFLTENEDVEEYAADGWVRLSASNGHVLAKASLRNY